MQELLNREATLIVVGVFSTTLGPLCEELAFRGFLMPLLAETFGITGGIVLAAIPFAIAHAPQYAYSWRHVALIGLAGVAFGWNRFRSGSTASATVMHGAYNLVIFAGLLYEKYQ
jgi:membrane protease YdiL (CAAX protease family)